MFDKVMGMIDNKSLYDKYFSIIDDYMYDNVVMPHKTKMGRTVLGLNKDYNDHHML